jgi:hypothetical protein
VERAAGCKLHRAAVDAEAAGSGGRGSLGHRALGRVRLVGELDLTNEQRKTKRTLFTDIWKIKEHDSWTKLKESWTMDTKTSRMKTELPFLRLTMDHGHKHEILSSELRGVFVANE